MIRGRRTQGRPCPTVTITSCADIGPTVTVNGSGFLNARGIGKVEMYDLIAEDWVESGGYDTWGNAQIICDNLPVNPWCLIRATNDCGHTDTYEAC